MIRGIPHNQFLLSVMQAMGLSPEDYERDGEPGYGSTAIDRDPTLWATAGVRVAVQSARAT